MPPGGGPAGLTREVSGRAPRAASRRASRAASRRGIPWRRWNIALHRDLGYLCVGLTLVYAVSGVAVNHRADWNPSYHITAETTQLGALDPAAPASEAFARSVLDELGIRGGIRGTFRPDPGSVEIFLEEGTVAVDLATGVATVKVVRPRFLLRVFNFLHLNEPRRLWTWMADLYAVGLALLALTGLFVLKGQKGITGRGAWLTTAGVLVPVAFLLLYL
ncbi:MAG: PepSY-associated TM helix domain-containing protein [Longimicrobiales bacterium]|nr:PepSY-associated TM helix domain-containing protein [Longimicrobiales bacterium]